MPDFAMCNHSACPLSSTCRRHTDSGTRPGFAQVWSSFNGGEDCEGYKPPIRDEDMSEDERLMMVILTAGRDTEDRTPPAPENGGG